MPDRPRVSEVACGKLGDSPLFYGGCLRVALNEDEALIRIPFRKITVPIKAVLKIVSANRYVHWTLGERKGLEILYETPNGQKTVFFMSVNPRMWFETVERLGIKTEDPFDLRHASMAGRKLVNAFMFWASVIGLIASIGLVIYGLFFFKA